MKSILLPTDFSDIARNAAICALRLLGTEQAEIRLTLLNTYLVPHVDSQDIVLINDQLKEKANKQLSLEKMKIVELAKGYKIHFETFACMGSVENVIPDILKKENFDLVAMGKNGGQYIENVSKVLKTNSSHCPLLIVYPPSSLDQ